MNQEQAFGSAAMLPEEVASSPRAPTGRESGRSRWHRSTLLVALYSVTIFVSSALLFLIQPMVAKMILPRFGGVPAVWTTSMVFFQIALLAGYFYAHNAIAWAGVRRQAALHIPLLLLAVIFLPFGIGSSWNPPQDGSPIPALLGLLTVSIGLPFFVVASSGPMLQKWFASTGHPAADDPYFLYAASNLGSLLGLLAYPILMEPWAPLADQARTWALGYGLLVVLMLFCALTVRRSRQPVDSKPPNSIDGTVERSTFPAVPSTVTTGRRLRWIALAFVPSSLMLGVTAHLSNDIAAVPMLWVLPLSLYLLTFVFTFSKRPLVRPALMPWAFPFLLLPLVLAMALRANAPSLLIIPLHLATFFIAAMVCHGELARDRPPPEQLTGFYLMVSVGGVLGGLANALIAPVLFDSIAEYPAALVLAALCRRPRGGPTRWGGRWVDFALPAAVGIWIAVMSRVTQSVGATSLARAAVLGISALAVFSFRSRRVRFALGIGAILFGSSLNVAGEKAILRERTFFGVHNVSAAGGFTLFTHGNTVHGIERRTPGPPKPLSYYHLGSPIGDVFAARSPGTRRVALVGLGTGSLACYASPDERWSFFEIDPAVVRIASDPRYFTFLRDCRMDLRIVLGDARLSLERENGPRYDIIVVDAFNSDSIPVHLMTREALRLYLTRLADDGVITFHVSNRYLDLIPVMASLARDARLAALGRADSVSSQEFADGKRSSVWVAMARRPSDLGRLATDPGWKTLEESASTRVWTDDYSNIWDVFRWR